MTSFIFSVFTPQITASTEKSRLVRAQAATSGPPFPWFTILFPRLKPKHTSPTAANPRQKKLCFGIGYHPAFALPFDDRHVTEDYEIRFDGVESPLCVSAQPNGLLNGQSYYLARNVEAIQLTDDLFDNDSHAMVNLRSAHVSVIEKDTGRSVICDVSDFPYTLIWSAPKKPLHFICIEPWHSLPGEENGPIDWEQRPCAAILKKGESWSTTLSTTFVR